MYKNLGGAALAALLLSSCATASVVPRRPAEDFSRLYPGGSAYLSLNLPELRSLFGGEALGTVSSDVKRFVSLSDTAVVGFYPEESGRRMAVFARGSYPSTRAAIGLCFSPSWTREKQPHGAPVWESRRGETLILDARTAFYSDGPFRLETEAVRAPPSILDAEESAIVAGWVENPSAVLSKALSRGEGITLPVQTLVFSLKKAGAGDEARFLLSVTMTTSEEREARAIASLLRISRFFLDPLDPNPTVQLLSLMANGRSVTEGKSLYLESRGMDTGELALLCRKLLVYLGNQKAP